MTTQRQAVVIGWPTQRLGEYGRRDITPQQVDRLIDEYVVLLVKWAGGVPEGLEVGASVPGRDRAGKPCITVPVYYHHLHSPRSPDELPQRALDLLAAIKRHSQSLPATDPDMLNRLSRGLDGAEYRV